MSNIKIGTFDFDVIKVGSSNVDAVYVGSTKVYPHDYKNDYLTFTALEDSTFKLSAATASNSVKYSLDGGSTWITLANNTSTPTVSAGANIMWKASGLTIDSTYGIGRFSSTGNFSAEGNVMSLHFSDNFRSQTSLSGKNYAFRQLFSNCSKLVNIDNIKLPATTLSEYCYRNMFAACGITHIPSDLLPATTLANFCYGNMFIGCNSLVDASNLQLPSLTLATNCYQGMFAQSANLEKTPVLSATTLVQGCYQYMFQTSPKINQITCLATNKTASNCTSNWVTGVASAGTFVKAASMTGWTSGTSGIPSGWAVYNHPYLEQYLTFTATNSGTFKLSGNSINYSLDSGTTWTTLASNTNTPTVSAGSKIMWKASLTPINNGGIGRFSSSSKFTVEGNSMSLLYGDDFINKTSLSGKNSAFWSLFHSCSGLTSAENMILPATTLSTNCYTNIFNNCTSLITPPMTLPATTLTSGCYYNMFYNCTGMTSSPVLSAETLVTDCYRQMFNLCKSLKTITCLATDISASNCTNAWVANIGSSGTFTKAASMSSWTTGNNGIPSGWAVGNT